MFDFEKNVGFYDSMARIFFGVFLISFAIFGGPHMAVGWLGIIPLVSGLMGKCPMYRLLGVDTRKYG
ncbi:YgaP family membrane protein [Roseospira navarrensis]|uniref:DUF2892 domain-containing protein n=1 Tax=Roseospira navarrensis TaxID=140058 RepID=A0A7X1ZEJ8_9PROT|nr:DUF2892 domain-containing protein [Roseospira navarrensis]MQX36574.1 DUF2892 domain-containing protein [Roseospira navarrensis]